MTCVVSIKVFGLPKGTMSHWTGVVLMILHHVRVLCSSNKFIRIINLKKFLFIITMPTVEFVEFIC